MKIHEALKLRDANVEPNRVRLYKHLPPDLEVRAQAVYDILGAHTGQDKLKWVDGFCFDMHPDREIAIWESYADAYKMFTEGKPAYYRPVAWRALLEHIADTDVVVADQAPTAAFRPQRHAVCPFTGSAKTAFEQMMKELKKRK